MGKVASLGPVVSPGEPVTCTIFCLKTCRSKVTQLHFQKSLLPTTTVQLFMSLLLG